MAAASENENESSEHSRASMDRQVPETCPLSDDNEDSGSHDSLHEQNIHDVKKEEKKNITSDHDGSRPKSKGDRVILSKLTSGVMTISDTICTMTLVRNLVPYANATYESAGNDNEYLNLAYRNGRDNMRKLEGAVSAVVDLNPVLGGRVIRVVERKGCDLKTETRHAFNPQATSGTRILVELGVNESEAKRVKKIRMNKPKSSFMSSSSTSNSKTGTHESDEPFTDEDIIGMNKTEQIDFLHKYVEPLLPELGFGHTQVSPHIYILVIN